MTDIIPFTDNYNDLSNSDGYQFEFRCERCGNGYRSAFQRDSRQAGQNLLRGVGNLFGGALSNLTSAADQILDRGTNSAGKDKALRAAVAEISPNFHQCRGCGDWVCDDVCWNTEIGQCARCSPVVSEELARLQAEGRSIQLREKLASTDIVAGIAVGQQAQPRCPSCGAQTNGGKFCGECGSRLVQDKTCDSCSAVNRFEAKFCAECGVAFSG